jgi:hypothetical protein
LLLGRDAVDVLEPLVERPDLVPPSGSIEPVTGELDDGESANPDVIAPVLRLQAPSETARAATRATRYIPLDSAVGRAVTSINLAETY